MASAPNDVCGKEPATNVAAEKNILVEYIQSLLPQLSFSFEIMKNEMPKKKGLLLRLQKSGVT